MDVGIGIVERTHPMGHNDHLYERAHSAFFDYTEDVSLGKPVPGIPVIKGKGTLEIHVSDKNGKALAGKEVRILNKYGEEVFKQMTGQEGNINHELPEYLFISSEKVFNTPFTVIVGKKKQIVELASNSIIEIVSR